jgi:alpha-glucosidase
MILKTLVALAACAYSALAAPYPHDTTSLIQARAANSTACPGYTATNIVVTDAGLTADLTLAGAACNAYSEDIKDLKLVVEHQTGTYLLLYIS